jgi:hypothetical protein
MRIIDKSKGLIKSAGGKLGNPNVEYTILATFVVLASLAVFDRGCQTHARPTITPTTATSSPSP